MTEHGFLILLLVIGGVFLLYIAGLIVHYERMLKLKDSQITSLQKDLNDSHAKLMTIDFEKFAEMNIRAQAEAMATWREVERTAEFSDVDIQEPTLEKVIRYGA